MAASEHKGHSATPLTTAGKARDGFLGGLVQPDRRGGSFGRISIFELSASLLCAITRKLMFGPAVKTMGGTVVTGMSEEDVC